MGQQLDAILVPSMSPAWLTDHVLGDHFVGAGAGYSMAAIAGTPSITVPVGEQLTKARKEPGYRRTLSEDRVGTSGSRVDIVLSCPLAESVSL